jgi:hypothetical protein
VPPLRHLGIYGGSDYAVTAGGGDTTVHAVVGLDAEGRMYLLDLWRRRAAADEENASRDTPTRREVSLTARASCNHLWCVSTPG